MHRLTVLYGHPADPAEFDRYYHEVHIPLARQMKGLKGWTIGKCQPGVDGERPPYYMIVGLYTDSREDLEAILARLADDQNKLIHSYLQIEEQGPSAPSASVSSVEGRELAEGDCVILERGPRDCRHDAHFAC